MKHNTLKRLASLATAGALALSLAVPAYADEVDGITSQAGGVDYEIVVQAPTIDVEVSANGAVILNPYMLAYEDPITGEMSDSTNTASVASAVNIITNRTQAPVNVDVVVTGSIPEGSEAVFKTSTQAAETSAKGVFLQLAMQGIADDPGEDLSDVNAASKWATGSWTATTAADWAKAATVKASTNKAALQTVKDGETTAGGTTPYYRMAANVVDGDTETPSFAAFKLIGDMATKSTEAWTEADGINVSVAFTFSIINPTTLSTT